MTATERMAARHRRRAENEQAKADRLRDLTNLQLLCGSCNRTKGTGSMAQLRVKLRRRGILAA